MKIGKLYRHHNVEFDSISEIYIYIKLKKKKLNINNENLF